MQRLKIIAVLFLLATNLYGQTVNDLRPTVTMKEYVDMQAQLNKEWSEKLIDAHIENIKDNVTKANEANEKRFENVNEFRNTLRDQQGTFLTRNELWLFVVAIAGIVFGIINLNIRKKELSKNDKL